MEYFLTTYNKDFTWPVAFSIHKDAVRQANKEKYLAQQVGTADLCAQQPTPALIVPDITPAQTGAPPAGPESKFGQPNTYLKKLYTKYPYLYNILTITPPEELAKAVYADKYQSTYMSDFANEGFTPLRSWLVPEMPSDLDKDLTIAADMDNAIRNKSTLHEKRNETENKTCNTCKVKQNECNCGKETKRQKVAFKPANISKIPRPPASQIKRESETKEKPPEYTGKKEAPRPSKIRSEYKDTISKMGKIIIDKRLLSRWPKEEWDKK